MEISDVSSGRHPAQQTAKSVEQKLKETTQEFEAILIASLLKDAQPSAQAGPFAGGLSHDLYQQLFVDEVAKAIARSGGIGVGKMLERQLRGIARAGAHENHVKDSPHVADIKTKGGE